MSTILLIVFNDFYGNEMEDQRLTIQIFQKGTWRDAATLTFVQPHKGRLGSCALEYKFEYALDLYGETNPELACSIRYPVEIVEEYKNQPWFAFIDDIIPSGAARRFWVKNLGIENLSRNEQDYPLLSKGAIAPIGNMRLKEALPFTPAGKKIEPLKFTLKEVISKSSDFLQHANELGAVGGGATGAGGEAPKFLVRCTADDKVWIDAYQDDPTNTDTHYLVKFARNKRSGQDKDVLRAEYHYYKILESLGVNTINTNKMKLYDQNDKLSLWLPRFDVDVENGKLSRYGMESVFSVLEKPPGTNLKHLEVIVELVEILSHLDKNFQPQAFVNEWVRRDFLNVVFGNSDNHGRNTSFLKRPGHAIELAPVYDFAPMKADPEGVIRTTVWGTDLESGGNFDWIAITLAIETTLEEAGFSVSADEIIEELANLSQKLVGLKNQLAAEEVPESILTFPSIGFDFLDQKLKRWALI